MKKILVVLFLGVLPVAVYWNALRTPFVLDDRPVVLENPSIRTLWPPSVPLSPPAGGLPICGRPVANYSFAWNYAWGGARVEGYHALNLALHVLTAFALAAVLRRTLASVAVAERFRARADGLALAIAALWAVHPLTTAAVTYVSQRTELLASLFLVLTLLAFIRFAETGRVRWSVAAVLACLAGMGSKETMAAAPLLVLLYDRTFLAGSFAAAWRRRGLSHAALMSTWLLLGWLVWHSESRGGTAGLDVDVSSLRYLFTQGEAIVGYLARSIWPAPLVFDYGDYLSAIEPWTVTCVAFVGGLAVANLVGCFGSSFPVSGSTTGNAQLGTDNVRSVAFAGAVFFAILAPTSSVVPVATQTIADHRMYLPLAAVLTVAVLGCSWILDRRGMKPLPQVVLAGAVVVAFGVMTVVRNRDFASNVTLWRKTVQQRPENLRARNNLAASLLESGDRAAGVAESEAALRLKPDQPDVLRNLAQAELDANRVAEALAHVERAQQLDPRVPAGWTLLGAARLRAGKMAESVEAYRRAVEMRPDSTAAAFGLAVALFQAERTDEALAAFEQLARREPRYPGLGLQYGGALLEAGKVGEALRQFDAALAHEPPSAELLHLRAVALLELGRQAEGIEATKQTLKLAPDYAPARELAQRLGVR